MLHNLKSTLILSLMLGLFLFHSCATRAQVPGEKTKPADYGIKSKKALSLFDTGRQMEKYRDYDAAYNAYLDAIELEPAFADALFRAGACLYVQKEYQKSLPYFKKAEEVWQGPKPEMLYFYYAEVALFDNDFEVAYTNYKQFMDAQPKVHVSIYNQAKEHYENAKFGKEAIKNKIAFEPKNMGEAINTQYEEYLPNLTADEQTIFFTSRRPGNIGGYNAMYRDFAEDFYYCELKDGEWQQAENLGPPLNTENNEGAASFSPDGQYVYFTACGRKEGMGDCDLYVSKLEGKTWTQPKNLGPLVNTSSWESQPCISNDGNTLYFSSNRAGGQGAHDLWATTKVNGKWGEPVNLGPKVNTKGDEFCPFLHSDGKTLYYSSNTLPGFGGLDLFMTKLKDGEWGEPQNLGFPLNTSSSEGNIFINTRGDVGYINSDRLGTKGKSDIFSFELDPKIRPEFTTYVRGVVVEKGTSTPLYSRVTFINLVNGDTIRQVLTNKSTGKFLLTLPVDEDYAAFVDGAKGYVFNSQNFSLKGLARDKNQYYDLKIELEKITDSVTIRLSNIFYETGKFDLKDESRAELDHLIDFLKDNPTVKIRIAAHTDDVGTDTDNMVLSRNRAGEVRKYLLSKGVAEARVLSKGYGETQPVVANDSDAHRAQNRRTEFTILSH